MQCMIATAEGQRGCQLNKRTHGAKTLNVFRACLGAQLTICAQKWRNFVLFSTVSLRFILSRVCVFLYSLGSCSQESTEKCYSWICNKGGCRKRGRPQLRWKECLKRDLRKADEEEEWEEQGNNGSNGEKKRSRVRIRWHRLETLVISFTPLCQCLSEEILKAVGPFYLGSMSGEVKDPTQGVNV